MGIELLAAALDGLGQEVVQRRQDVPRRGMVRTRELVEDLFVALGTVQRRHDRRHGLSVVRERIRVLRMSLVTFEATDSGRRVRAGLPVIDDSRGRLRVAVHAGSGGLRDRDGDLSDPTLLTASGDFFVLDEDEGQQEKESEDSDHGLLG